MNPAYTPLFQPITLGGVEVKNRVAMAPMTNFSSNEDGTVTDAEVDYYRRRSRGVGMVITACAYVRPNGKGFPGEFSVHDDAMIPSLRRLAHTIQDEGTKAILQIFHGGRSCPPKLVPNADVVSASAVAGEGGAVVPRSLEDHEVRDIVIAFGEATRRAIEAGYDGVEIHGANGYLIQQFFSPHSNQRTDEWGGSLEKRMSFPLAVVHEVRRVVRQFATKPFIVGYRFSPEEATVPGITMDDTLALVGVLADEHLDYLHVSLQDFRSKPRSKETVQSRLELIVQQAENRVPVIGVGAIRTPDDAVEALQATGGAVVALGREIIIDPDWVEKVKQARESEIATTLAKGDRERLHVPEPLWQRIVSTPGWFPGI